MQSSYQEQLLALSATCRGQQQEVQQLQAHLQQCTHDKVRQGACAVCCLPEGRTCCGM
jgi:hypothetical protein